MRMGDLIDWDQVDIRRGTFRRFTIQGTKYRNKHGTTGWHTTIWPESGNPIHDFWVSGGEFHSLSIHYSYNFTSTHRVEVNKIAGLIDPNEKAAILGALSSWDTEFPEHYSGS